MNPHQKCERAFCLESNSLFTLNHCLIELTGLDQQHGVDFVFENLGKIVPVDFEEIMQSVHDHPGFVEGTQADSAKAKPEQIL